MRIVTPFNVETGQLTATNVVNEFGPWEPAATNLLSYPRRFDNAYWTKAGNAQVFPDTFLAPDGTLTAERITGSVAGGGHVIKTGVAQSGMVKSIYLRTVSGTGKIGSLVNSGTQVFDINENWQRFDYPAGDSGADSIFYVADFRNPATLTEVVVWHAQLEEGTAPTSVIPDGTTFTSRASTATYIDSTGTLQTVGVDAARDDAYGYVDGVLKPIGLLLESAATNLLTYSDEFTSTSWGKNSVSVESDNTSGPFGTGTSDRLHETSSNSEHHLVRSSPPNAEGTYTQSVYLKAGTLTTAVLLVVHYGEEFVTSQTQVNMAQKTITNGNGLIIATSIETLRDGWIRASVTYKLSASASDVSLRVYPDKTDARIGDPANFVYIWGAQLEEGYYPTSYIPTQGSQVTRAADVSSSPQVTRAADSCVRVLGDEFNQTEWSISGESTQNSPVGSAIFLSGDAGLNGKSFRLGFPSNAGQCLWFKPNDTASNVSIPLSDFGSIDLGEPVKWAASYGNGAVGVAVNGVYRSRLVAGSPENLINMRVGQISGANNNISGSTRNLLIYPKALSEAELIAITGVN